MHNSNYSHIEGRKINDFMVRRRNYQKHLQKLREIQDKRVTPIHPDMMHSTALNNFKERNRKFTRQERRKQILQYNSKVFDKLVDISSRKPNSSFQTSAHPIRDHHNSYYNQKESFRKVNAENFMLVHRIMTQVSPLSHKKQEEFFMRTRQFKDRLEKYPFVKSIDRKLQALNNLSCDKVNYSRSKRYSTQPEKSPNHD